MCIMVLWSRDAQAFRNMRVALLSVLPSNVDVGFDGRDPRRPVLERLGHEDAEPARPRDAEREALVLVPGLTELSVRGEHAVVLEGVVKMEIPFDHPLRGDHCRAF